MEEAFLIIDFGSSALKVHLLSAEGALISEGRVRPRCIVNEELPLAVQLDAKELEDSLAAVCRSAASAAAERGYRVVGVGVTTQRFNMVLLDREGRALLVSPNVDSRGFMAPRLLRSDELEALYAVTGLHPPHLFTPMRLEQLREGDPGVASRAARILTLHDWLIYLLTGVYVTEPTMAGSTMLFDVRRGCWSGELLEAFGVNPDQLPEVVPTGSVAGYLTERAARLIGAQTGTPVVACGGDSQAALVALGALDPLRAGVAAGHTVPVLLVVGEPLVDREMRTWLQPHARRGVYVVESNAGPLGRLIEWFVEAFRLGGFEALDTLALKSSPGSRGVRVRLYPSIMNARMIGSQDVGGQVRLPPLVIPGFAPIGLEDLARAVLEFVAFSVRANVEQASEVAGKAAEWVGVAGGLTRLRTFREILPSVMQRSVAFAERYYASSLGCAAMVAAALGEYRSWEAAASAMCPSALAEPREELSSEYQSAYASWLEFYRSFA